METSIGVSNGLLKILLSCGIVAAFLYVIADILGIFIKPGYNFFSETAGLLSAPGTVSRPYVVTFDILADLVLIAFAAGVWITAGGNWAQRVMALFMAANALFALVGVAFFPMHPDEATSSQANKLNVIFMASSMFGFVLAILFGIPANHNWLRWVSLSIIEFYIVATVIGLIIPRLHGPTIGIQERTMTYTYLAWLFLQSLVLLQTTQAER